MRRLISILRRFRSEQTGATAIEYAIIASGIAGALIVTVTTLGSTVKTVLYDKLATLF
jgi:pilus assembly protein Flp/PilA